jgi:hypothetical protein
MKEEGYTGNVIQTSNAKYGTLEESDNRTVDAVKFMNKHGQDFLINVDTERLHKKGCPHAGKAPLNARIINVGASGLKVCKHCIKS